MAIWRGLRGDVGLSIRRLVHEPGFSAVCLLTLALGIGGNAAVFTLIHRVMFETLPVPRPAELHRLGDTDTCCVNSGLLGSFSLFSHDLYLELKRAAPQFSELAAFQASEGGQVAVGPANGESPPLAYASTFVSGNYFDMFGLSPAAGRLLSAADDQRGAPAVAVISHRLWTHRDQGRADVAGMAVLMNGVPATIVGVAPAAFYGEMLKETPADFWIPISSEPLLQPQARLIDQPQAHWLYAIGRLAPGTDTGPIAAQLTARLQQWIAEKVTLTTDERTRIPQQHVRIVSAARGVDSMREEVGPSLRLLQAVAAAVLLIACANLANLLLARGATRRTETAMRVALGAPRSRLIRQLLIESALLACAGGLLGLFVSYAGARAIVEMTFRGAPVIPVDPTPSPVVLAFAFGLSLVTAAVFGTAPAMLASRSDPMDAMRGAGRSTAERGTRLRQTLIALQVAVSLVLVTCAGLLGRSLINLQQQDFGFRTDRRYVATLATSLGSATSEELASIYARVPERLGQVPGVASAALSLYSPMSGDNWSGLITVEGRPPAERLASSWVRVGPGYFTTLGTPVLRGRAIDERDRPGSRLVAVVNQTFAGRFFGGGDPIGRRFGFAAETGPGPLDFEIVGIVADIKYRNARRPANPTFFMPFLQLAPQAAAPGTPLNRSHYPRALEIHATAPVPNLERDVRQALADIDRRITVSAMTSMDEQVARRFNMERVVASLTGVFGVVALLLACLGLYGVTAYWIARRTREIGIRMAIGASRGRVLRTVLGGALAQLAAGLIVGLPAALLIGRVLRAQLYGIGPADPLVLAGALGVLGVSAVAAALVPARRAASLDPVTALRIE
jgi:predicted permease